MNRLMTAVYASLYLSVTLGWSALLLRGTIWLIKG